MSFSNVSGGQSRRFLRDKLVGAKIGASRSHVWRLTKGDPDFPKPIRLSTGLTVWDEQQIDAWIETRRDVAGNS